MKTHFSKTFLLCGATGWCMEILWSGLHSLLRRDPTLMGKTSLLMFPIYGCAAVIDPVSRKLSRVPAVLRGSLYTAGFFATEFVSGSILRLFHMCPWDYSHTPFHYKGLIRFDYIPVWFAAGLFFEKIIKKSS